MAFIVASHIHPQMQSLLAQARGNAMVRSLRIRDSVYWYAYRGPLYLMALRARAGEKATGLVRH